MSPPQHDLSEDYIAELLKREARDTLNSPPGAFETVVSRSSRPTSGPSTRKPNLRFLNNIIRETDTHNSALKLRELEQAGDRLRKLRGDPPRATDGDRRGGRHRRDNDHDDDDDGRYEPGSSRSLKRRKQRRGSESKSESEDAGADDRRRRERRARREGRLSRPRSRSRSRSRSPRERRRRRDGKDGRGERQNETERRRESKDGRRSERSERRRSRDRGDEHRATDPSCKGRHERQSGRSYTDDKSSRRSDRRFEPSRERYADRAELLDRHDENFGRLRDESVTSFGAAPVIRRGRGVHASRGSAMDARFMPTYDPKTDFQPDDVDADADDWERGLEAMRDRAQFQKIQGDRLRAAGFSSEQVEKWERGKREEDVKWKSRVEGREWDRGKVVQDDGTVAANAEWTNEIKR